MKVAGSNVEPTDRFAILEAADAPDDAAQLLLREIVKTGFAYSTHPEQIDLVVDPNDAAIAIGGTFPLTRVAYWGPNTGKVNDAISQALERIYLGDQDVDAAFEQANEEIQGYLDES